MEKTQCSRYTMLKVYLDKGKEYVGVFDFLKNGYVQAQEDIKIGRAIYDDDPEKH